MADRLKRLEQELGLTTAPSPFAVNPKIICRRVEVTLSAEEPERKCYMKYKLHLTAALTAVAIALTGTALAAGPTLSEMLQTALGTFAPYAQPMEGTVEDQGIRVKLISALADSVHVKVYVELTDLWGQDRLAMADMDPMSSRLELNVPQEQQREGIGYSYTSKRLGYDPETQTLLAVLERNNGVLLDNSPTGSLQISRITSQRQSFISDEPVPVEKLTRIYLATQQLPTGETVPVPGQSKIDLPGTRGVTLSSMGFTADGRLHFLFCFPSGSSSSLSHGLVSIHRQTGPSFDLCPSTHFQQDGLSYFDMSVQATPADLGDLVFSQAYGSFGSDADDIEGHWSLPLTVKQVEEHSSPLAGALGPVSLEELRLSPLGITVVTRSLNDVISGYPMWVWLSDGSKFQLDHGQSGSGGYLGPNLNRWDFPEPMEELTSITGISIGCWMIPVNNGTAGEGYWLPSLPE